MPVFGVSRARGLRERGTWLVHRRTCVCVDQVGVDRLPLIGPLTPLLSLRCAEQALFGGVSVHSFSRFKSKGICKVFGRCLFLSAVVSSQRLLFTFKLFPF